MARNSGLSHANRVGHRDRTTMLRFRGRSLEVQSGSQRESGIGKEPQSAPEGHKSVVAAKLHRKETALVLE